MKKDPLVYVEHILNSIKLIEIYTKGISLDKFLEQSMIQDAVIRQLEVIGEASAAVNEDFRLDHKSIPWNIMEDFRNKLIHEYFSVDSEIVWQTVIKDLPEVKSHLLKIIKNAKKRSK